MNLTHVHLLLNHFPTVGMIVGLGLFLFAIFSKNIDVTRASLVVLFGIALVAIPAFATGTAALLDLQKNPDVSMARIAAHKDAAFKALWFMELTGALAWLALWQYRRLSRFPQGTLIAVLLAGLLTFGLMTQAANIGGEIRHPEIRSDPAAQDPDAEQPTITSVLGAAMVDYTWAWAASETIHFIGLSLLVGVVLLVDLRMLGFMKAIPYTTLHRILPWGVLGFGLNTLTGMLFFVGNPPDFYITNTVFVWKLALILVAGANALYFTVFEQPWTLGAGETAPMAAKVAAASGILLWMGIIFCGQMLPFFGHSF